MFYGDGGAFTLDPVVNTTYYASGYLSSYDSVYTYYFVVSKSTDAGVSWRRDTLVSSSSYMYCQSLAVHPANTNLVYAGAYNGLFYKSTDGGSTWNLSNTGLSSAYYIYDIAVHPTNVNILYIGTSNAVFKSTNGGANWSNIGLSAVNDILVHPLGPDTIYAGTGSGFYKSTNAGTIWTAINGGLLDLNVTKIAIKSTGSRADSTYLFAGTRSGGVHRMFMALVPVEEVNQQQTPFNLTITPNPANARIHFAYRLQRSSNVKITIYDIQGRAVGTIVDNNEDAGSYRMDWDSQCLPAGIYFVKADIENTSEVQKLILVR